MKSVEKKWQKKKGVGRPKKKREKKTKREIDFVETNKQKPKFKKKKENFVQFL